MARRITLPRPDDWHVHLRDGEALTTTVPDVARTFGRAVVMPNLKPPVRTLEEALAYRARILAALPPGVGFEPLMTLYLTDATSPAVIEEAARHPAVVAAKLYPAGATTHSDDGVTDLARVTDALFAMAEHGLVLCVHGEVTRPDVDVFYRERVFLEEQLAPLVERVPGLRVVLEHVTTAEGVAFVRSGPEGRVAATLTAHHLLLNRNALFVGGIRPHHYCLPVLKSERHRQALVEAAVGGDPRFFLGTDSAPHARGTKEAACGCAGCYTAPFALGLYAEVFDEAGALERLEGFASRHGPAFYGLEPAEERITLVEATEEVPELLPLGADVVVPLRAGGQVRWRLATDQDG